jgi:quercetin dioxygenase-like cupin family protein
MKVLEPRNVARGADSRSAKRPATAILAESRDVRLIVFRLSPGQSVPRHKNASSVVVTVLEGDGMLSGAEGERHCHAGDVVMYDPSEPHAIRALETELLLLVAIAPTPSARSDAVPDTTA